MIYSLGQFVSGHSLIHRIDPALKISGLVALSVCTFGTGGAGAALLTAFLAGCLLAAGLTPKHFWKAFLPYVPFFALLFLLHLLFTEGKPLFGAFPRFTHEGLDKGLLVSWRFFNLVFAAVILTMTTSPSSLVCGIERLLRPLRFLRIPSQDIALMISLALRFVPVLSEEFERIRDAQAARGLNLREGPPAARLRKMSSLIIPFILGVFRRADELALAMEARGYRRGARTYLREARFSRSDYGAAVIIVMLCVGLLVLGWGTSS